MSDTKASVHWEGAGPCGQGHFKPGTGTLKAYPYGFSTHLGDGRAGDGPEALIGAAHAACFTMAFAVALETRGRVATSLDTRAAVRLARNGEGLKIDRIAIELDAAIPDLDDATFQAIAAEARSARPLSRALAGIPEITLKATLRH